MSSADEKTIRYEEKKNKDTEIPIYNFKIGKLHSKHFASIVNWPEQVSPITTQNVLNSSSSKLAKIWKYENISKIWSMCSRQDADIYMDAKETSTVALLANRSALQWHKICRLSSTETHIISHPSESATLLIFGH